MVYLSQKVYTVYSNCFGPCILFKSWYDNIVSLLGTFWLQVYIIKSKESFGGGGCCCCHCSSVLTPSNCLDKLLQFFMTRFRSGLPLHASYGWEREWLAQGQTTKVGLEFTISRFLAWGLNHCIILALITPLNTKKNTKFRQQ